MLGIWGTPANVDDGYDFEEALKDQVTVVPRQLGAFGPMRALREAAQGRLGIDLSGHDKMANGRCWHDRPCGRHVRLRAFVMWMDMLTKHL